MTSFQGIEFGWKHPPLWRTVLHRFEFESIPQKMPTHNVTTNGFQKSGAPSTWQWRLTLQHSLFPWKPFHFTQNSIAFSFSWGRDFAAQRRGCHCSLKPFALPPVAAAMSFQSNTLRHLMWLTMAMKHLPSDLPSLLSVQCFSKPQLGSWIVLLLCAINHWARHRAEQTISSF